MPGEICFKRFINYFDISFLFFNIYGMDREICYAFIDSQNLNLGTRSLGWELDFKRFRRYLRDKYRVEKAFLFLGYMKENEKLYAYLKSLEYILVFKPAVKYK